MYDSNSLNTPSNVLYDEETIPVFAVVSQDVV